MNDKLSRYLQENDTLIKKKSLWAVGKAVFRRKCVALSIMKIN